MKNLILAGLLGLALGAGAVIGHSKLVDKELNNVRYSKFPVCLMQEDDGAVYVIESADQEAKTYSVVKQIQILTGSIPNYPARDLNKRTDLKPFDCETGELLGQ